MLAVTCLPSSSRTRGLFIAVARVSCCCIQELKKDSSEVAFGVCRKVVSQSLRLMLDRSSELDVCLNSEKANEPWLDQR